MLTCLIFLMNFAGRERWKYSSFAVSHSKCLPEKNLEQLLWKIHISVLTGSRAWLGRKNGITLKWKRIQWFYHVTTQDFFVRVVNVFLLQLQSQIFKRPTRCCQSTAVMPLIKCIAFRHLHIGSHSTAKRDRWR